MNRLIDSITTAAITIVGWYVLKYIEKKGENLAQKEDIQDLTRLVKEVEHSFNKREENYRNELDLNKQLHIGLHQEARNAVIELHNAIYEYYHFITDLSLNNTDLMDNNGLRMHEAKQRSLYNSLFIAKSKVILFVDDNDKIESMASNIINDIAENLSIHYMEYNFNIQKLNLSTNNDSTTEFDEYFEKRKILQNEFVQKLFVSINMILPELKKFSSELRNYLKSNKNSTN